MRKLNSLLAQFLYIKLDTTYLLQQNPPWDLLAQGDAIYEETLKESRFEGMISVNDVPRICVERGIIPNLDYEKDIMTMEKGIAQNQIKLYEARKDPTLANKIRVRIKGMRDEINRVHEKVFAIERQTREFWAAGIREDWIISQSLFYLNKTHVEQIFNLDKIKFSYYASMFSDSDLRMIARSEPWRTLWRTRKGANFQFPPMNSQQVTLARWSSFYDNVFKSPECPDFNVINDDDMLDGWVQIQGKSDDDRQKISSKVARHKEQFIVVDTPEEAQEVWDSNSAQAKAKMQARQNQIRRQGAVQQTKLKDFQMDMLNAGQHPR